MDVQDYKALIQQSTALQVVIDTNFNIICASDAFLKTSNTNRDEIIGKYIFDVFPDNSKAPGNTSSISFIASFNRVITNKIADILPIIKYDIPNPNGGGFIPKHWKTCHSPILDDNYNVKYIVQVAEDVTENETLTTELEQEKKEL
jgi:transcriptional regulator with PAS, ATPase and Fis domain